MSAKRTPTIRLLRVGNVLRAREDHEVLCRVIELGVGQYGGGHVVEIFEAGTELERLVWAPIRKLLRINGASLRFDFERVGHLPESERSFTTFSHWDLGHFLLAEDVIEASRAGERKPPRKKRSTSK